MFIYSAVLGLLPETTFVNVLSSYYMQSNVMGTTEASDNSKTCSQPLGDNILFKCKECRIRFTFEI